MKRLLLIVSMIIVAMAFTGCTTDEKEKENLAIVVGNRSNSATPNLSSAEKYIREACKTGATVSIISVEGTPRVEQIDIPAIKSDMSAANKDRLAEEHAAQIIDFINQTRPSTGEADLMAAITLAARALHSCEDGNSTMLIFDSGISTKGEINFVNTMLEGIDTDKVMDKLMKEDALYNMDDIKIVWIGLGNVCEPQMALSEKNRKTLQNVWDAILSDSGAEIIFKEDIPLRTEINNDLPEVSVVDLLERVSVMEAYDAESTYLLDSEILNFKPNSYELITDASVIEQKLSPIIDYMIQNQNYKILLCGTTASAGTKDELRLLSEQRCNTIKEIIVSKGVNEDQIMIKGLGYNNMFCAVDVDEKGNFIESVAKTNRQVIILPLDSEQADFICNIED